MSKTKKITRLKRQLKKAMKDLDQVLPFQLVNRYANIHIKDIQHQVDLNCVVIVKSVTMEPPKSEQLRYSLSGEVVEIPQFVHKDGFA